MDRPPPGKRANRAAQQGSIAVAMAGVLLLGLILLGSVQIGYTAYIKRELQKTADAAALSGVQVLGAGDQAGCDAALTAARINTGQNFPGLAQGEATLECGVWDEGQNAYRAAIPPEAMNAVRVFIRHEFGSIVPFVPGSEASVEAVASAPAEPIAVFSVGPRLVEFNNDSVVGGLLYTLGLDVTALTVLSERGVLDSRFKMGSLLQELGLELENVSVGGMDSLLDTRVGLQSLLDAGLRAANQEEFLHVGTSLVQSAESTLAVSGLDVLLGGEDGGLFGKIGTQSLSGALNAELTLEELIGTALAVATAERAFVLQPEITVFDDLKVSSKLGVAETPSIGIGGVGTTAHSAQARAFVDVSGKISIPILSTDLDVKIPLGLELIQGSATLEPPLCDDMNPALARFKVDVSVGGVCIGNLAGDELFSREESCGEILDAKGNDANARLLSLRLLGIDLLRLRTRYSLPVLPVEDYVVLAEGESALVPRQGNDLRVGSAVADLNRSLLPALFAQSVTEPKPMTQAQARSLAEEIWNVRTPQCNAGSHSCRVSRLDAAKNHIEGSVHGLGGLLSGVTDLLGDVLSLDVLGLLPGLTGFLDNTLSNTLRVVLGNGCTTTLLGLPGGNERGCLDLLTTELHKENSGGGISQRTGILVLLGGAISALQAPLDMVGQQLAALVDDVVGLRLNQAEVRLISLQCGGAPRLMR